jgi:hypothetical protein
MNKITVDAALRERLNGLKLTTEFFDEKGCPLGTFVPNITIPEELVAAARQRYTPEIIDQLRQQKGNKTLADFWKEIGVK